MVQQYNLIKRLGFGAFGDVWLATNRNTGREVAIKILRTVSPENLERFQREARIYYQERDNKFIVDLLDHNLNYSTPFLVLDYYKRGSLRSWVKKNWYDVGGAIQHAAMGLESIHTKGGHHRDIKPDNLLISDDQSGQLIIKVGDFGYGRLPFPYSNSALTCTPYGTPGYIAPELYQGRGFTAACDIYSLGITGIELITGSRDRDSIKGIGISPELKQLLLQMTSTNPNGRPDARMVSDTIRIILRTYAANFKTVTKVAAGVLGIILLGKVMKKAS